MAAVKKTVSPEKTNLLNAFSDFLDVLAAGAPTAAAVTKVADEEGDALDRDAVNKLGIVELRKLAADNGITEKKKADILSKMEDAGLFGEDEDEDDEELDEEEESEDEAEEEEEDEDDEEEEEEDDEEELTREDLAEMNIRELRTLAKEQGHKQADYRSLDQDGIIDLILGAEETEEEDEEDEEDEDEIEIDEDSLKAMSETELKSLAKDAGIKVLRTDKKAALVKKILAAVEEDEDE